VLAEQPIFSAIMPAGIPPLVRAASGVEKHQAELGWPRAAIAASACCDVIFSPLGQSSKRLSGAVAVSKPRS
jgi:hypothetical protein